MGGDYLWDLLNIVKKQRWQDSTLKKPVMNEVAPHFNYIIFSVFVYCNFIQIASCSLYLLLFRSDAVRLLIGTGEYRGDSTI